MKKLLPLILFFLPLASYFSLPTLADFEQNYQSYLYQYDQYRTSLTNFLTAKNRYLTYKTLVAQTEALSSTKTFLATRDQVLLAYFRLLLETNPGETYRQLLEEETAFFSEHKNLIPAVGSLEDALKVSESAAQQFPRTEVLSRQVISSLLLDKVKRLEQRLSNLESGFAEKINSSKNQGKEVTTLERWLLSAKNKRLLSRDKLGEAESLISQLKPQKSPEIAEDSAKIQVLIFEANQYLKEAVSYLGEVSEELKYGNY